ncbi:hypothetical protein, partial [Pseudomonas sp.]|uniref:hypothetical protein n=1 Tax=Pseudomonas sp. TaxID=306 RepID=UPI00289F74CF
RIHTFQACSFDHSDTSPFIFKPYGLSRCANLVKDVSFGKHFFQFFHAFASGRRQRLTGRSALLLYLACAAG